MHEVTSQDCSRIAQDLQIRKVQVESVVELLKEGNTVPFLARYRKEKTGGLSEEIIRQIQSRLRFLHQLAERKQTILKSLENQGKLSEDLRRAILGADTTKRLDDLYLPYKPKKRTPAGAARDRGLEPPALAIWNGDPAVGPLDSFFLALANPEKGLNGTDDVRNGVHQILAEMITETASVRAAVRGVMWETGKICSAKSEKADGQASEFKDYFHFSEPVRQVSAHRILALNRGEKEGAIKVRFEWPLETLQQAALKTLADFLLRQRHHKPETRAKGQAPIAVAAVSVPHQIETSISPGVGGPDVVPSPGQEIHLTPGEENSAAPSPPVEPLLGETITVSFVSAAAPAPQLSEMVPPPASPLVASLTPETKPLGPMTGELLSPHSDYRTPHRDFLKTVLEDAVGRLLVPSLEREIRGELTDEAEAHAAQVLARNLRRLLMQPPLKNSRILAINPGFRAGCKLAALDESGNLLDHAVIFPLPQPARKSGKENAETTAAPDPAPAAAQVSSAPSPEGTGPKEAASPQAETPAPASEITTLPESSPPENQNSPATSEVSSVVSPPAPPGSPEIAEGNAPSPPGPSPDPLPPEGMAAPGPSSPDAGPQNTPPVSEAPNPAAETAPESPPPDKRAEAMAKILEFVGKHQLNIVAIGNGPGCREMEELVSELIAGPCPNLAYGLVNEAGTRDYAVSPIGREEFPQLESGLRATVSIGRRLLNPLNELVKVDPHHLAVGLFHNEVPRRELKEALEAVIESCLNQVGVDVNTAQVWQLRHLSGLNQLLARDLVEYRKQHGSFANREQLLQIPSLGPTRYQQAAGFLKIDKPANPFDAVWIHPENYDLAEKILADLGLTPAALNDPAAREELRAKVQPLSCEELTRKYGAGEYTIRDICQVLAQPGWDPRDEMPPPIFKKALIKLEDLQPGQELKGTVLNVVDFGAFVDVGLKDSGLVHISQMANRYIKSPYDVVAVHDVVTVWVLSVDKERHRVSLTMIKPGTERRTGDKGEGRAPEGRRGQGRGRRPSGPPQGQPGERPPGRRPPHQGRPGHGRREAPASASDTPQGQGAQATHAPVSQGPAHGEAKAPPPRPPLPPRKPRRPLPKTQLSQDALEGKVPLRTFRELSALFAAKQAPPTPPRPPEPVPEPAAAAVETPSPQETPAPVPEEKPPEPPPPNEGSPG